MSELGPRSLLSGNLRHPSEKLRNFSEKALVKIFTSH